MFVNKGGNLIPLGQYYSGILLPQGAEIFWFIIAPGQIFTSIILPPPLPVRNQRGQLYTATPGMNVHMGRNTTDNTAVGRPP